MDRSGHAVGLAGAEADAEELLGAIQDSAAVDLSDVLFTAEAERARLPWAKALRVEALGCVRSRGELSDSCSAWVDGAGPPSDTNRDR
jgi:hypothetical protein